MSGPLQGLRVLSLAEQYPGPYATLIMSDLGADVVLVERPAGGEPARRFPSFFESLHRNKRSLCLDLKADAGREAFKRLAAHADVVLEGYRPGTMARLGLDYDTLAAINPRLVYASISGYGQDGPYMGRTGHDLSYQSTAGMLFAQSRDPSIPFSEVAVGDLSSAMFAVIGVQSALLARERTGRGTYVDVSMTDGLVSWMTIFATPAANKGPPPEIMQEPGYGIFTCADGKSISLSIAYEDWFWKPLCELMGMEDVIGLTREQRVARCAELKARLGDVFAGKDRQAWVDLFDGTDVPFGPVNDMDDVIDDPHIKARGMFTKVTVDGSDRFYVRQPLQMRGFDTAPTSGPPALGQHTRDVLQAAGFSEQEIAALIAQGVARDSSP